MKNEQKLIQSVLKQLGRSNEAKYYLNQYQNSKQVKFAVIKVGGNVIASQLDELVDSLSLLSKLGLTPIVLHGAGPQIDTEMKNQQMFIKKLDGLRVSSSKTIGVINSVVESVHQQLIDALEHKNIKTQSLLNEVFNCEFLDVEKYGFVGKISNTNLTAINKAISHNKMPIISCLGSDDNNNVFNINADVAIRKLVWETQPAKVIFVTPTGGLLGEDSHIISAIQLANQYKQLMQENWLHSGMKLKIQEIYKLLKPMPRKLSVSITSAQELVKELFTHKGNGTYISMGENINHHKTIGSGVKLNVISLLETTFKKKLKDNFFEALELDSVLISDSKQAVAIISKGCNGKPYLNKFAVTSLAQGQGLGKALWQKVLNLYPEIYWRSRINNTINSWYYNQAQSSYKKGNWVIFSCGMSLPDSMQCLQTASEYEDSWTGEIND
jgi:acetylglutamate kinase